MNYWSDERRQNEENWLRPFGLRRKSGILRSRSCAWNYQTLRTRPRLAGFSLATPFTP